MPKTKTTSKAKKSAPKPEVVSPESVIQTKTTEFLRMLGFEGTAQVVRNETGQFLVEIETPEPNLLIGFHGQTLASIQLLVGLSVQKELKEWSPIIFNVGDYRQRREEQLRHLAQNIAQRVRFSGQPQVISRLSSSERRIVHLTLAEDEMVETVSEGEGSDRHLIVRPRQTSK